MCTQVKITGSEFVNVKNDCCVENTAWFFLNDHSKYVDQHIYKTEVQKLKRFEQNGKINSTRIGNESHKVIYHKEAGIVECHGAGAGDQKSELPTLGRKRKEGVAEEVMEACPRNTGGQVKKGTPNN